MRRQVLVLAVSQAVFQTAAVMVATVGGLAGSAIAPGPQWATVPVAAMFLGTALCTFPAAGLMARVGRKGGFLCGALLGCAGALISAAGLWVGSLWGLMAGMFLFGAYQSFAQFYRFAASEVADDLFRPRAIALVLGGGVVAAFVGPELARFGGPLLGPAYTGSFLILAVMSLLGAVALLFLRPAAHQPQGHGPSGGRSWRRIVMQPAYLVALLSAATGYGVMVLAMTATPLAMICFNHQLASAASVVQLHVLGMFLPSFFTGTLIARFGVVRIMAAGLILLAGHVVMTLVGTSVPVFAVALILLGIGWNFLYIGGTTLLTQTYAPAEKSRAQATNDMMVFAVGLGCSFSAGWLLQTFGWQALNLLLLPWLAVAAIALIVFALRGRLAPAAVVTGPGQSRT